MKIVAPLLLFFVSISSSSVFAAETIPLFSNTHYCMQKKGTDSPSNGDNVHLWSCTGKLSNMLWKKVSSRYVGYYQLELGNTGYCLAKQGTNSPSSGNNVHLWSCVNTKLSNSLWKLEEQKLKLYGSNLCAQKEGKNYPKNGDNVHLWDCDKGDYRNSQWYLKL